MGRDPGRRFRVSRKPSPPPDLTAATGFAIHFRKSPHERFDETAATLEDARTAAAQLELLHGKHGRRAGIYALIPGRRSVFVE